MGKLCIKEVDGLIIVNFDELNTDIARSFKMIRGLIYIFNLFKNKEYHNKRVNLPIVDAMINQFFGYKDSKGDVRIPSAGEVLTNEWVYNILILNLFV